jgi:hypothetical protein
LTSELSFEEWAAREPQHAVVEYLIAERASFRPDTRWPNFFLDSLVLRFIDKGKTLSVPQLDAAQVAIRKRRAAALRLEEDSHLVKIPVPEGQLTFEGEIVGVKMTKNQFYRGDILKVMVLVTTGAGSFKLWGTCPVTLHNVVGRHGLRPLMVGDTVRLTATVKASGDPGVGFFSAPREGVYLGISSNTSRQSD